MQTITQNLIERGMNQNDAAKVEQIIRQIGASSADEMIALAKTAPDPIVRALAAMMLEAAFNEYRKTTGN